MPYKEQDHIHALGKSCVCYYGNFSCNPFHLELVYPTFRNELLQCIVLFFLVFVLVIRNFTLFIFALVYKNKVKKVVWGLIYIYFEFSFFLNYVINIDPNQEIFHC
jgi:hypothetical protein